VRREIARTDSAKLNSLGAPRGGAPDLQWSRSVTQSYLGTVRASKSLSPRTNLAGQSKGR